MNRTPLFVLIGIVTLFATGCAWVPQHADIKPTVATGTVVAQQAPVSLSVEDARKSKVLGHTRFSFEASIKAANDPATAIRETLTKALTERGFSVTDSAPAKLAVALNTLETNNAGLGTYRYAEAKLTVTAARGDAKITREYAVTERYMDAVISGTGRNANRINTQLSAALEKLLADKELLALLAGSGGAVAVH